MVKPPPTSFPALLGLRAVVASLVFTYHYYGREGTSITLLNWLTHLNYRMTIFFVLSGFGVMMSLLPRQQLTPEEYFVFLYKRFLRLFPLYLVLLIIPYLQVGLPAWPVLITNLTLTKGFFQRLMFSGIGPAWSLSVEISFYLVAPFILPALSSWYKIVISYFAILLTGITLTLLGLWLNNIHFNPYGFFANPAFVQENTFFGRATDFFMGILLARFFHQHPHKNVRVIIPGVSHTYLALLLVFGVSFSEYYFRKLPLAAGSVLAILFFHILLPLAVGYLLYGLIHERTIFSRFLASKLMLILGSSSYGFYLMHTSWVEYKLSRINPLPDQSFVLLWLTAIMVYYLFEKPVLLFFRKRLLVG